MSTGNTPRPRDGTHLVLDHPRVHGEYSTLDSHLALLRGSPPCPRGIQGDGLSSLLEVRITPVSTGNTAEVMNALVPDEDHPRVHGEYGMMTSQQFS